MPLYIRKAIRVGPIRYNLSKSGIGVSVGVRGFRLGSGPRGNYVHMGRGGLYFRHTLSPGSAPSGALTPGPPFDTPSLKDGSADLGAMTEIESVPVAAMADGSSRDLLDEMNLKHRRGRWLPPAFLLLALINALLLLAHVPLWASIASVVVSALALVVAGYRDATARTTVVMYDLEDTAIQAYQQLHEAFAQLMGSARVWHVSAQGAAQDRKYTAGASTLIRRSRIALTKGDLPFIKTNVEIPVIPVGKQSLAFLPDRLLVVEQSGVGAVSYPDLTVSVSRGRFIEDEPPPPDAELVDHTWRYVNKNGGPDRRFADNPQLPIMMYDEMHFQSQSGLNELIQLSRPSVADSFGQALTRLAQSAPATQQRSANGAG